jgi:hypothetical protein
MERSIGKSRKPNQRTREKGALWTVREPVERLRELVAIAVRDRCGGSQGRAAREFGLSKAWLSRLLSGRRVIAAEWDTLYCVMNLLGDEKFSEWRALVMPPGSHETIGRAANAWVDETLENSSRGTGQRWIRGPDGFFPSPLEKDAAGMTARDRERKALWQHVHDRWPKLAKRFDRIFTGDYWRLGQVALCRVLDPLIDDSESGYFMASWRELHPTRLEAVITLGIRREEKLLLPLSHPVARIVRASDVPITVFAHDHGKESVWP